MVSIKAVASWIDPESLLALHGLSGLDMASGPEAKA